MSYQIRATDSVKLSKNVDDAIGINRPPITAALYDPREKANCIFAIMLAGK